MTVATPAPNRKAIATSSRRFWKADAKYAGSITETQQGANSAIAPATTAAMTDPPRKTLESTDQSPAGRPARSGVACLDVGQQATSRPRRWFHHMAAGQAPPAMTTAASSKAVSTRSSGSGAGDRLRPNLYYKVS